MKIDEAPYLGFWTEDGKTKLPREKNDGKRKREQERATASRVREN